MQIVTVLGCLLGLFAVFGGALLEGLHLSAIMQPTAAIIVFGGTLAAMLVSFPQEDVVRAFKHLVLVFRGVSEDPRALIDEIIEIAYAARKEGLLGIEAHRAGIKDPLFRKAIKYVIDGFDATAVASILDAEIDMKFEEEEQSGKVWEAAGGYSPTIGIIGAVLGLIHVMQSLDDPSKIGSGIAVAFVATVYGVAAANLAFIPWGSNLKRKAHLRLSLKEIVKIGVLGIQEGVNPHSLKERLLVFASNTTDDGATHGSQQTTP